MIEKMIDTMMEWSLGSDLMGDYNNWELVFLNHLQSTQIILLCVLMLALFVLSWINLKRISSKLLKILLMSLRVLFVAGLLLLLIQPAIQLQKVIYRKSHVIILSDQSRSMSLETSDKKSRIKQVGQFFKSNEKWLKSLGQFHHLHAFGFAEKPRATSLEELSGKTVATGEYSAIDFSISEAIDSIGEQEIAGVLLLSDGVSNNPPSNVQNSEQLITQLKERGIKILSFGAGSEGAVKDVAIKDVRYDGFGFVHNKMTIEVDVSSRGYKKRSIQINLATDDKPITARQIEIDANSEQTITFSFMPDKVGRYIYTVGIPPSPDDALKENNKQSFIIDVIRDKIRVLHVCGHPDYDEQFMRRFLKNNPNVDLISFFILRTNADLQLVPESELSLIPFPTEELFSKQLHTFDLVIFQNFTYRGYKMKQFLPNIKKFVLGGGAFLVIGGDVSYQLGGYDQTEIEDILPFEIIPLEIQADSRPFKISVSDKGLRHPIMQIKRGLDINRTIWKNSPKLFGTNLGLRPYADTLVLAEHPFLKDGNKPVPIIGARTVGMGRVLALSIDSSWLWHFNNISAGYSGELYYSFWNNAIRWLIKDPELKHLKAKADKDVVSPGEEIKLDLRLSDDDFQPKNDAKLSYEVLSADGKVLKKQTLITDQEGSVITSFTAPKKDGMLRINIESENSDGVREKEELLLFVSSRSSELDEVNVDFDNLKMLAKQSGGWFKKLPVKMDEQEAFGKKLKSRIGKKRDVPIWDNAYVLAILVFLIALEWWLRKRNRLN